MMSSTIEQLIHRPICRIFMLDREMKNHNFNTLSAEERARTRKSLRVLLDHMARKRGEPHAVRHDITADHTVRRKGSIYLMLTVEWYSS
jgi:hypothetical protein